MVNKVKKSVTLPISVKIYNSGNRWWVVSKPHITNIKLTWSLYINLIIKWFMCECKIPYQMNAISYNSKIIHFGLFWRPTKNDFFQKIEKKSSFLSHSGVQVQHFNHLTKKLHHVAQNTIFGLKNFLETTKMTFSKNQKIHF